MECVTQMERASLFLDGRLGADEQRDLFSHLASCTACRQFLEASVRVRQIARAERIEVPAGADEALFDAIARRSPAAHAGLVQRVRQAEFWHRRWSLPAPAFALIVAVALGLGILLSALLPRNDARQAMPPIMISGRQIASSQGGVVIIYALPEQQVTGLVPASAPRQSQPEFY